MADPAAARRVVAAYEKANAPAWPRSRAAVLRFFDGFDLVEPGLVPKPQWRPDPGTDAAAPDVDWCGVARLRSTGPAPKYSRPDSDCRLPGRLRGNERGDRLEGQ